MPPETRAKVTEQFPIEDYGYEEIPIPPGKDSGKYNIGSTYEDAEGNQMRLDGYDNNGKPVWVKP